LADVHSTAEEAGLELIHRHGLVLVRAADMSVILQTTARRNLQIYGVEGFFLMADGVMPDPDGLLDLSDVSSAVSADEAQAFVSRVSRPDNYYYEITL